MVGGVASAPQQREGSLGIGDVSGMGLHTAIGDGERRAAAEIHGPGRNGGSQLSGMLCRGMSALFLVGRRTVA